MPLSILRLDGEYKILVVSMFEDNSQFVPGHIERFGKDASLRGHRHKVRISAPPRERVKVHVVGDASTCSLSEVETHVDPSRKIDLAKSQLRTLGEIHQFMGDVNRKCRQRIEVQIGQKQQMSGGVGKGVEADKAMLPPVNDVGSFFGGLSLEPMIDGVVDCGDHIAEDAVFVLRFGGRPSAEGGRDPASGLWIRAGDVAVAPRRPEAIHSASIARLQNGFRPLKAIQGRVCLIEPRFSAKFCTLTGVACIKLCTTHENFVRFRA
jgi:hypothetical protein